MDLTEAIRDALDRDDRTQAAIARAAGIDEATICRFYTGERDMRLATAAKLCKALNLELRPIRQRKGK